MKNSISKKLSTFILAFVGMFSFLSANAQTSPYFYIPPPSCPAGQIWGCHWYKDCTQACKCVDPDSKWINKRPHKCLPVGADLVNGETGHSAGDIYPIRPFSSPTIYITLEKPQKVSLKIFDMSGRLVKSPGERVFAEGRHQVEWGAADFRPGIYILKMEMIGYSENRKLIVAK